MASVIILIASAAPSFAAFQTIELSVSGAAPGTEVQFRVEISHHLGSSPSVLWLIEQDEFEGSPEPWPCEDKPGAVAVGELTWQPAPIEFQGSTYAGFIGEAVITVPDVAAGTYVLAETISNEYTGCHRFTSFQVTDGTLPDTAMAMGSGD